VVDLAASTDGSYALKAWTGDAAACGSSPTCRVTMNGDRQVGAAFATVPVGFGAGTTGGQGGAVVTVTTPAELKAALCDTFVGGRCADTTPRIIQLSTVIDFRGTEGSTTGPGCTYSNNACSVNGKSEQILAYQSYCAGKTIHDVTYDTAGPTPLRVGSNKTLLGIGTGAGIKGKGLTMSDGMSNIIVRNLSITDINEPVVWGGDAITIDDASRIWIDHDYIARIGRQMIVTGWGTAANVTISNSFLDGSTDYGHYCDGRHYWMMLLVAQDQSITLIGNKIYNSSGRSPELGKLSTAPAGSGGTVHIVNNLYDQNYYMGVRTSDDVLSFIEGNYFTTTGLYFLPIFKDAGTDNKIYAPVDGNAAQADLACSPELGRTCSTNYLTTPATDFILNPEVMARIQPPSSQATAIGSVRPFGAAAVPARVAAAVGPQPDPDE
jgi:pectin lyase